jgi:hypothetical protein
MSTQALDRLLSKLAQAVLTSSPFVLCAVYTRELGFSVKNENTWTIREKRIGILMLHGYACVIIIIIFIR